MTQQDFRLILTLTKYQQGDLNELDACGIYLRESSIIEYGNIMCDFILSTHFNREGIDIIYDWVYEDESDLFDKTVDELWEIVKDFQINV